MKNVEQAADEIGESKFEALPERVREALGELAGAAKEGLLGLSVDVGLGVLTELMEEEVDDVVGPKGRHDAGRSTCDGLTLRVTYGRPPRSHGRFPPPRADLVVRRRDALWAISSRRRIVVACNELRLARVLR